MRLGFKSLWLSLAVMIEPSGNNLVFLLSTPRAGSTLLGTILGNHSRILCPNEPWLLLSLHHLYAAHDVTASPHDQKRSSQALREFLPEEDFLEGCRAFALAAYNRKLAQAKKITFVDKTPRYYHILPFIERLFSQSKKIWLKRNPLDVAASFRSTWKTPVAELVGDNLSPFSFDVTLSLSKFISFFQGQSNTFELRYEDLVERPRDVIDQLCAFLEIIPEPGLENYGAHSSNLDLLKRKTMGDKKLFDHTQPHRDSVNRWQSVLSRSEVQRLLDCIGAGFFERMGYADTLAVLKHRGFKFPSQTRVEQNLLALQRADDSFGQGRTRPRSNTKKRQAGLASPNYWWQKLGQRLGVTKNT